MDTITDGTVKIQRNELILSSAILASTAHPRDPSINRNIPRSDLVASYFSSELFLKGLFGIHCTGSLLKLLIKSGRSFLWDNNSPTMATVTRMSRRKIWEALCGAAILLSSPSTMKLRNVQELMSAGPNNGLQSQNFWQRIQLTHHRIARDGCITHKKRKPWICACLWISISYSEVYFRISIV